MASCTRRLHLPSGMSGQIHADFLRLLWVLADKQMRSYFESMGKEDKIGTEAFRWARAKVFTVNAFLATTLTRVMRAAVPIPAVASASVLHSAAVGGSVVGVVRPL